MPTTIDSIDTLNGHGNTLIQLHKYPNMTSVIHLVRHAESEHNVSKDFSQLDPPLTALGREQAAKLVDTFHNPEHIGVVVTSPLRRAIQTALAGFSHVLNKRYYDEDSGLGVENGIPLFLDPNLQERSTLPCDTGSENAVLEKEFKNLNLEVLSAGWRSKSGFYAEDDATVDRRAERVRQSLKKLAGQVQVGDKRDVVVVTHGVFMKFLSGDQSIDLPKAGWRSYSIESGQDGNVSLAAI